MFSGDVELFSPEGEELEPKICPACGSKKARIEFIKPDEDEDLDADFLDAEDLVGDVDKGEG
jgi:hypothetical protein